VSPDEVIKESGADILRLWCASAEFTEDVRASPEILERVSDAYRKIRNTARFALGNLDGFDRERDSVAESDLEEIDRWALLDLDALIAKVRAAYEAYQFHVVFHTLYDFSTVTLSARYFDILKDRLYTFAPQNRARRSAQTALYRIVDALARLLAPIMSFTADEIWENIPGSVDQAASVHLLEFPLTARQPDAELSARWAQLFEIRDKVLRALEDARVAKTIGSSLEAGIELTASGSTYQLLERYQPELRYLFIVSQVSLTRCDIGELQVNVRRADGEKCERCWNYSTRVGESSRYPTVCERCIEALKEIEAGE
jgi:isoleucyl-tRNA synthetase